MHHVYALSPERDHLEIQFPRVEGYARMIRGRVKVKGLAAEAGGPPSLMGPGKIDEVKHQAWRKTKRIQELEFEMAGALARRYGKSPGCEVHVHVLFPQVLAILRQFLRDKVQAGGSDERKKDVFLNPYWSWALETLDSAIIPDDAESPEVPRYEAHRGFGSTRDVDFWTSKAVRESERSHLNWVVMDTEKWEQTAAYCLDSNEHVAAFVKNFNLGFAIPYVHGGDAKEYLPDFLARLHKDGRKVGTLILETKGFDPLVEVKAAGAKRWVDAVNAEGSHARWAYRMVKSPTDVPDAIRSAAEELARD